MRNKSNCTPYLFVFFDFESEPCSLSRVSISSSSSSRGSNSSFTFEVTLASGMPEACMSMGECDPSVWTDLGVGGSRCPRLSEKVQWGQDGGEFLRGDFAIIRTNCADFRGLAVFSEV